MSSAVAILTSVEESKLVQKHTKKRQELEEKCSAALAHHAALLEEREHLQKAHHERSVTALLSGVPENEDGAITARLGALDEDLSRARLAVAAVNDALERHDVIAAATREQVQCEINAQIDVEVEKIRAAMHPHVEQLYTLTEQLMALAERAGSRVQVPTQMLLNAWLEAFAGGRR